MADTNRFVGVWPTNGDTCSHPEPVIVLAVAVNVTTGVLSGPFTEINVERPAVSESEMLAGETVSVPWPPPDPPTVKVTATVLNGVPSGPDMTSAAV
jgi:hypothetical protein